MHLTIIPNGSNPSGSIRIDCGTKGSTDGNGNVWLADQGFEAGAYVQLGGDYPGWFNAGSSPEIGVYESDIYTFGSDLVYNFVVPNGNYKIRLMMGTLYNGQPYYMSTFPYKWSGRLDLEAQGQIAAHNYDFALNEPSGYTQIVGLPADTYIPAKVTNNTLEIAVRGVFLQSDTAIYGNACSSCMSPGLNGLEVIPDGTPAHWSIDTQQMTTVSPGSSLQLYQVDWYTGLSDVQWSIISGPGTISSAGLYTAPTTQPAGGAGLVIKAQSASNPAVSATATLRFTGNAINVK
jgi:hypothetical protein